MAIPKQCKYNHLSFGIVHTEEKSGRKNLYGSSGDSWGNILYIFSKMWM